ncbi:DUF481 domain-containing protein [Pseudoalteromonas denitrificans]|uniref:Putative salt-induced outer membrane protein YdiY n=1 Tax=Pseudoalteromonas denitrificans DSM 6059 TaxID=1123010 RepID=A0A1I1HKH9_9GAMM|nr:DUF481 domain-containing protein [Pseudoalteromonas denitrificans]SFC21953.1 Putative salt-induced outer membrane protein YdiY [Pseudoalteromonas denitrificans DSM 6059]
MYYHVLLAAFFFVGFTTHAKKPLFEILSDYDQLDTDEIHDKKPLFEILSDYGQLDTDEIHDKRRGELFYGDTEFGLIVTSGNTQSSAVKFKGSIFQDLDNWRNQFKFDSLLKKDKNTDTDEKEKSAERYFLSLQGNYKLGSAAESFFIYSEYEKDKFGGFKYQTSLSSGYGNRLYSGHKNTLDFDMGPGVNYQVSDDDLSESGFLLRLALHWQRNISQRTRFNQTLSSEKSLSGLNSRLKSETSLVSQINNDLSLKFSYLYRYNSSPEDNKTNYDGETSTTIVYNFN